MVDLSRVIVGFIVINQFVVWFLRVAYIGGKEKNKHQHKKTQGTQGRSTKTKTPVVGMRSRGGMLVAAKMDKKSIVPIFRL